jgi:hypothetical protein
VDRRELENRLRELGWYPTGGTKRKGIWMWKHPRYRGSIGVPDLDILRDQDGNQILEFARKGVRLR